MNSYILTKDAEEDLFRIYEFGNSIEINEIIGRQNF